MLQRFIDDIRTSAGTAVRQTSLAAIAAICLLITTAFLCAAAFIAVLNRYGPVEACFAGAAIFFVCTLIAAGIYLVRKRQIKARAEARAKAASARIGVFISAPGCCGTARERWHRCPRGRSRAGR